MAELNQNELDAALQSHGGIGDDELQKAMSTMPEEAPEESLGAKLGKGFAGAGLGALQGISELGRGIAGGGDVLLNKLLGTHLQAPKGDVFYGPAAPLEHTLPAKIGEAAGKIGGTIAGGEVFGPETLTAKALAYGGTAAATQPGGLAERGIAGGLGVLGGAIEQVLSKAPYLFVGKVAKKLEKLYGHQKDIGNILYKNAFKGAEDVRPVISNNTRNSVNELLKMAPSKASPINKSFDRYMENPDVEGMHTLKSDLSKIQAKLGDKALKSGLTGPDMDMSEALDDVTTNLSKDVRGNLNTASPDNVSKYDLAQQHWKENVVPFRKSAAIRKALGPDKEISPRIYSDLIKKSVYSDRLRKLLKVSKGNLQVANILHKKIFGLPLPLYLGAGGYYGIRRIPSLIQHLEGGG